MLAALAGLARAGEDPFSLQSLDGPVPSLARYCADRVREAGDSHFSRGRCPARTQAAPFGEAALISFSDEAQVPLTLWHVALRTARGWFAGEAPICMGRGCQVTPGPIDVRAHSVTFHFTVDERTRDEQQHARLAVVCVVAETPSCTGALPLELSGRYAPNGRAALRLALTVEEDANGVTVRLQPTRSELRGHTPEVDGFRKQLPLLAGAHRLVDDK